MTVDAEAGVRLPPVCPFVAFADERDLRSAGPDHRHRCYAESPPASRALAHQSRYCLSPTFTGCPIFQDWATREAARVSDAPASSTPAPDDGFFAEPAAGRPEDFGGPAVAGARGAASASYGSPEDDDFGRRVYEEEDAGLPPAPASREWERVRPRRDYPRLGRSRRTSPVLMALVLLAVAAVAVFLLPSVLRGLLGSGTAASPSATASGSASLGSTGSPTAVPSATATPGPTQLLYVVKSGDTLTRIANQFDVTVEQILAANPEITNPNNISVGQQIVIPTATPAPGAPATESPPP